MNVSTRNTTAALVGFALSVAFAASAQGQADPRLGSWKLNVAKSTYTAGAPAKSGSLKYEAAGAAVKVIVDSVAADGTTFHWEQTAAYDGKDSKITGKCPYGDMVSRTKIDAQTTASAYKQNGKVTVTNRSVVAADGKTLTITQSGALPDGSKLAAVLLYER